jgi:hypothetical protein
VYKLTSRQSKAKSQTIYAALHMQLLVEIPDYNPATGFEFTWADGFETEVELCHDGVMIKYNKAGLLSLATQLLTLAQDDFGNGYAIHLDKYVALEGNSIDLIIVKKRN